MSAPHKIGNALSTPVAQSKIDHKTLLLDSIFSEQNTDYEMEPFPSSDRIVWLDLELYSLEDNCVLECAVVLTTCNSLQEIARKNWVLATTQDEIDNDVLGGAAAGFHHENSVENGLIKACLRSSTTQKKWQKRLLRFLKSHCMKGCRLAGFSVHCDREVLRTQAPLVYQHLSHRIIDISSLDIIQWELPALERAARADDFVCGNHRPRLPFSS